MSIFLGAVGATKKIVAKTKSNQSVLNKAVKFGMQYFDLKDAVKRAYNNDNARLGKELNLYKMFAFDKYEENLNILPSAEQKRVEKYVLENYKK